MQTVFFYFDDSGVLNTGSNQSYFIYAGYYFKSHNQKDAAKRKYVALVNKIKAKKGISKCQELKAFGSDNKTKRALFKVLEDERSVSLSVEISKLYEKFRAGEKSEQKRSLQRYKDYVLKMAVKKAIRSLIQSCEINPNEDITINIYIDEQSTATNGLYSLKESIYEELQNGVHNYDYNRFFPPIFLGKVTVCVQYCDSSCNYLIQAADILANRIYSSKNYKKTNLMPKKSHLHLNFP